MSELYWNDARVEQLSQFVTEGRTFEAIGALMGINKNKALGKAYRMGFVPDAEAPLSTQQRVQRESRGHKDSPTLTDRLTALNKFPGASRCVYPHGHRGEEDFHFCGERTSGIAEAYCPSHRALCWKPVDTAAMKQLNYAAGRVAMVPGLTPAGGRGFGPEPQTDAFKTLSITPSSRRRAD